jgi:hypothetical protein
MRLYFRGMAAQDGKPRVGRNARCGCAAPDIEPIQDGVTHVSLCPRATMLLERYEAALAATRLDWHKVTEDGMDI